MNKNQLANCIELVLRLQALCDPEDAWLLALLLTYVHQPNNAERGKKKEYSPVFTWSKAKG